MAQPPNSVQPCGCGKLSNYQINSSFCCSSVKKAWCYIFPRSFAFLLSAEENWEAVASWKEEIQYWVCTACALLSVRGRASLWNGRGWPYGTKVFSNSVSAPSSKATFPYPCLLQFSFLFFLSNLFSLFPDFILSFYKAFPHFFSPFLVPAQTSGSNVLCHSLSSSWPRNLSGVLECCWDGTESVAE